MLIFCVFVSKCPTSQLIDVWTGRTNGFFVCSGLNEQLSEESGEHRYKYTKYISAEASLCKFTKNYLLLISFVNSTGSTIFPSLYTRILPEAISSIRITSLLL